MDRLKYLGIIRKGLTSYISLVVLVNGKIKIFIEYVVTFAFESEIVENQSCIPISQRLYRTVR